MLTLTPKAEEKIRSFFQTQDEAKGKSLRVMLQPAGCSGFKYAFAFDEKKPEDLVLSHQGFDVVIDKNSAPYLEKATVDYGEDATSSGFKIKNPMEKSSCGCGESKKF
jgi:iron-sulfur cluster assembly protein